MKIVQNKNRITLFDNYDPYVQTNSGSIRQLMVIKARCRGPLELPRLGAVGTGFLRSHRL